MTTTAPTIETITAHNSEAFKTVRKHNRLSRSLFLALCSYLDKAGMSDTQKERAQNALANVGGKMLAQKNALPSDPSKLRMHVESIKQKCEAIVASLNDVRTFANVAQSAAIRKEATNALENVKLFLAEYVEHKQAVAAAKAA
jgi:hypothetical protein